MGLLTWLLPALGLIMGYTGDCTVGTGASSLLWNLVKELVTPKLCGISEDPPLWVVSRQFVPLTSTLDYSTGAQQDMKDA